MISEQFQWWLFAHDHRPHKKSTCQTSIIHRLEKNCRRIIEKILWFNSAITTNRVVTSSDRECHTMWIIFPPFPHIAFERAGKVAQYAKNLHLFNELKISERRQFFLFPCFLNFSILLSLPLLCRVFLDSTQKNKIFLLRLILFVFRTLLKHTRRRVLISYVWFRVYRTEKFIHFVTAQL